MYEKFYGFKEKPFEITPDPSFFFSSEYHKEALAHLQYAIREGKGFTVITGEAGSGKTTLVRTLLRQVDGTVKTAYIFNPTLDSSDFIDYICDDLGIVQNRAKTRGHNLIALHHFLLECYARQEKVFLIVDEAQTLDPDLLQQIRLLTNLETEKDKLLHVMLIGQPELNDTLEEPRFRPLKQRITVRYHLRTLTPDEVGQYILYRLKRAGAKNLRIFYPDAVKEIYKYSRGIPRLINILCDNALLTGFSTNQSRIDKKLIREVVRDINHMDQEETKKSKFWIFARYFIVFLLIFAGIAAFTFRSELAGIYNFITGWL